MSNPLLSSFNTAHEMPPFSKIETDHYEEAIEATLAEAKKKFNPSLKMMKLLPLVVQSKHWKAVEKNYNEIHRSFST